ncbi:MAG: radical SAM protein [Clostridia bacterium]|nr:radical SAM protein [Clostridia bacterium]
MIELWKPYHMLRLVLPPQRLIPERVYRRSQYAFPFEADGRNCLFHVLTRQCYDLEGLKMPEGTVSGADLAQSVLLNQLVKDGFFVPAEKDEDAYYVEVIRLLRRLKHREGRVTFTILPTTACNARCVYCFEEGMVQQTMSPETAARTLDFICDTRRKEETLWLNWFGGEPLLGTHVIDRICRGLTERSIPFASNMTTNGSLIDENVLERMNGPWHIKKVAISMDGDEEAYFRRKKYYNYRDTYRQVIEAAGIMAGQGIDVNLRINVDWENLSGIDRFADDLERILEDPSVIRFYLQPLHSEWLKESIPDLWNQIGAYQMALESRGFSAYFRTEPRRLKLMRCPAHDPERHAIIAPDGGLYACDKCVPGTILGNIRNGIEDQAAFDSMAALPSVQEKCRGCAMLPECTTTTQCPLTLACCKETRHIQLLWALRREVAHLDAPAAADEEDDG